MRRLLSCTAVIVSLLCASGWAGAQSEEAEERQAGAEERRGRRGLSTYVVDDRTAKRLREALIAVSEERFDDAEAAVGRLRERSLNPLERQQAYEIRAYVAYGRNDLAAAREHFESAIAQGQMTSQQLQDTRFQIAQLYLAEQMWAEVVEHLNIWFGIADDPSPVAYYLLALAHYQNGDPDAAMVPAQKAVDGSPEPQESWLQLLLALKLTKKDYEASIPLLEELVRRFPKRTYWLSLSTVHGALGDYQNALVPLQLAHTQGYLTEDSDLRRLAQLLLFLGLPYRAAEVLQEGLAAEQIAPDADVFEMLGNSWIAAREYEKTVEPLTRAAELAADGDLFVRLAQVQIQREQWAAAALALRRALELGDLEKPGDAKLLMGIAFYNSERPKQALSWFTQARTHEETRGEAEQWLLHIEREQQQAG